MKVFVMLIIGVSTSYFKGNTITPEVLVYSTAEKCIDAIPGVIAKAKEEGYGDTVEAICTKMTVK